MSFYPKVTLIIPVYNGANYLHEAITSALSQTYKNIEVIVVNDGSDDGGQTDAIAKSYNDQIRYIDKPNAGVASALNAGIGVMQGEYFSWLSHDDVYYPDKIARQVELLAQNNNPDLVVFCEYDFIDEHSRVTGSSQIAPPYLGNTYLTILSTSIGGCSLLIPKKCFDHAGLFNEKLKTTQDNEMWLRIAKAGFDFQYIPEILMGSRVHPEMGSQTMRPHHQKEKTAFYLWAVDFLGKELASFHKDLIKIIMNKGCYSAISSLLTHRITTTHVAYHTILIAAIDHIITMGIKRIYASRLGRFPRIVYASLFRSSRYWEHRYASGGDAGPGSHGALAQYKAGIINAFVTQNNIQTVIDYGCGDGTQLALYCIPHYIGVDVSATAIEKCRKRFQDDPTKEFLLEPESSPLTTQLQADLALSIDVLYHLVEDDVFYQYIHTLFAASKRFVLIYSTDFNENHTSPHQIDRTFTAYIARTITAFELIDTIHNPYKGSLTKSDFYIYRKIE